MRFPLGRLFTTPAVLEVLSKAQVAVLVGRHVAGDWSECYPEDAHANVQAVESGDRILSVYTVKDVKFYVITEADRSVTTVLLATEY